MGIKSLGKLEVSDNNANAIYSHTGNPETNVFSIRLHCFGLVDAVKGNIEDDESMPKSVEYPLHKQCSREAFPIDTN